MTPRRILLLMGGLFAFGAVYAIYARAFGWLDGLPILQDEMLIPAEGEFLPPTRPTSPTIDRLKQAFGEHAPETEPAFYPTQLEFRNGDTSLVLASGSPPTSPNSNRVTLSPVQHRHLQQTEARPPARRPARSTRSPPSTPTRRCSSSTARFRLPPT